MAGLNYPDLAKKIVSGLVKGDINPKSCGISGGELQKIYRRRDKEGYEGSIPLFVCKKIYEEYFDTASHMFGSSMQYEGFMGYSPLQEDGAGLVLNKIFKTNKKKEMYTLEETICANLWVMSQVPSIAEGEKTNVSFEAVEGMFNILNGALEYYKDKNNNNSDT